MALCSNCGADNPAGKGFCGDCGSPLAGVCSSCGSTNPAGNRFCGDCGASLTRPANVPARTHAGRGTDRRAPPRVGPVRRPGRLHDGLGRTRRRGDARAVVALLRPRPHADRPLRGDGREVHRRRGDGGLGHAGGAPRTTPSGPSGRRSSSCVDAARRESGNSGVARSGRRRHGRGGRHRRRGGARHGRRRPREHRLADPVPRRARGAVLAGESTVRATEGRGGVRGRGSPCREGEGGAARRYGGRCGSTAGEEGTNEARGSRRSGSAATASCACSRSCFTRLRGDRTASVVAVVGIGRDRKVAVAWEFYKYVDGLADGRCGITAAVSPMARVSPIGRSRRWCRKRSGSLRRSPTARARSCERWSRGGWRPPRSAQWIAPRLAQLLGVADAENRSATTCSPGGGCSSSGWPSKILSCLVFEDVQWADTGSVRVLRRSAGLVARRHPIFVLMFARPEVAVAVRDGSRPRGRVHARWLDPLDTERWRVPRRSRAGIAEDVRQAGRRHAEGMPLYAVETVRVLLERGLVAEDDGGAGRSRRDRGIHVPATLRRCWPPGSTG